MAISLYRQAIDLHPYYPNAYCKLATALHNQGKVRAIAFEVLRVFDFKTLS